MSDQANALTTITAEQLALEIDNALRHGYGANLVKTIVESMRRRIVELEDLLVSARSIASRRGEDTAWERFDNRLLQAGIGSVTAKVFRMLPSDERTVAPSVSRNAALLTSEPPRFDATNHHSALLCPYCNPKGLKLTEPRLEDAIRVLLDKLKHWYDNQPAVQGVDWITFYSLFQDTEAALDALPTLPARGAQENP